MFGFLQGVWQLLQNIIFFFAPFLAPKKTNKKKLVKPESKPQATSNAQQPIKNIFDALRKESSVSTENQIKRVIEYFDKNNDNMLNREEFKAFLGELVIQADGTPAPLKKEHFDEIFGILDIDGDGQLDASDLQVNWKNWVKPINQPRSALIIVDVQNDFIDGSLALKSCPACQDGARVVPIINKMREVVNFDLVVFTIDSHPPDHCSFCSNIRNGKHKLSPNSKIKAEDAKVFDVVKLLGPPEVDQILWPDHCIQGSWGEELHKDLVQKPTDKKIHKGSNPNVDSYSAFWDNAKLSQTPMIKLLQDAKIDTLFICGLAFDVCVGYTALHALEHGFVTYVIEDATAGVTTEGINETKTALTNAGGMVIHSEQVPGLFSLQVRPCEVALHKARVIRKAQDKLPLDP